MYATSLANNLLDLYKKGIATDFTVICEDETFNLHKAVSIHGSGYFADILTSKDNNEIAEVTLDFKPTIHPSIFRCIVKSLYTGIIQDMTIENITALLEASYHLQIKHSYDACVKFMLTHLDLDNCLSYWLWAKLCQSEKLKQASIGFIGRHLDSIKATEQFLLLSKDTIEEILAHDSLEVPTEERVFEAAIAWIKYDEVNRKSYLSSLLSVVRLTHLPVDYLENIVGKEDLIQNDPNAMSYYSEGLKMKLKNIHGDTQVRHNPIYAARGSLERILKQNQPSQCIPNTLQHCRDKIDESFGGNVLAFFSKPVPKKENDENFSTQDEVMVPPRETNEIEVNRDNIDSTSNSTTETQQLIMLANSANQDDYANLEDVLETSEEDAIEVLSTLESGMDVNYNKEDETSIANLQNKENDEVTKEVGVKRDDIDSTTNSSTETEQLIMLANSANQDDYANLEDVLETSEEDAIEVLSTLESGMDVNYNKEDETSIANLQNKENDEVTKEVGVKRDDIDSTSNSSTETEQLIMLANNSKRVSFTELHSDEEVSKEGSSSSTSSESEVESSPSIISTETSLPSARSFGSMSINSSAARSEKAIPSNSSGSSASTPVSVSSESNRRRVLKKRYSKLAYNVQVAREGKVTKIVRSTRR